jgi:hypothetical protein
MRPVFSALNGAHSLITVYLFVLDATMAADLQAAIARMAEGFATASGPERYNPVLAVTEQTLVLENGQRMVICHPCAGTVGRPIVPPYGDRGTIAVGGRPGSKLWCSGVYAGQRLSLMQCRKATVG